MEIFRIKGLLATSECDECIHLFEEVYGPTDKIKDNYTNAKFSTGKRYNADLNASYNIATRGILKLYYPSLYKQQWSRGKPNACPTTGNPLVLSSLWLLTQSKAG